MRNILQIYIITNKQRREYVKLVKEWEKYFNVEVFYLADKNVKTLLKKKVDFIFVDEETKENLITWEFLFDLRAKNPYLKYLRVQKSFNPKTTYKFLKAGTDDIIFLESDTEYVKWKTIATLRRRWATASNDNIIFHRGLIIDKVNSECILNDHLIELSKKEFQVLKVLTDAQPHEFVERIFIYKKVWKHNDNDPTRVVQQIIQNLKRKIGKDYFEIIRNKGIKLK